MRINRVRLEIREVVLCASVKQDFNTLTMPQQLAEIQKSSPRRITNFYHALKQKNGEVISAMLKRHPGLILSIKKPTPEQVRNVLDTHPQALNKIPTNKRTEDLVIKAIRPKKKHIFGPADIRANETIKNIALLDSNTPFTGRVYKEITSLVRGGGQRTLNKLIHTFEKQKRKIPEELLSMVKKIATANVSDTSTRERCTSASSIVKIKYFPFTLTVQYPTDHDFLYEYYIGDPSRFNHCLGLQQNAGAFSKYVKEQNFSVKKLKQLKED